MALDLSKLSGDVDQVVDLLNQLKVLVDDLRAHIPPDDPALQATVDAMAAKLETAIAADKP